jgi:hypothetical protein
MKITLGQTLISGNVMAPKPRGMMTFVLSGTCSKLDHSGQNFELSHFGHFSLDQKSPC